MDAFWIILTGALTAIPCALTGSFLVLRRMAMLGDAVSHAVLPGIVVAYLFSGSRDLAVMLPAACITGMGTAFLIELLQKKLKVQNDASVGIVFTALFALGVVLVTAYAGQVDLDQECVLYGEINYVPLDTWITASGLDMGPRAVWMLGIANLLVLGLIAGFYRPLLITSFDPGFAGTVGVRPHRWQPVITGAVSVTCVTAFESVGAILVVALMTAPVLAAYLLTGRLKTMLLMAVTFGILSSIAGYYLATLLNASVAGAMSTVAGALFAGAWLYKELHTARIREPQKLHL